MFQPGEPLLYNDAVLSLKLHHIPHRCNGRDFQQTEPFLTGYFMDLIKHLHQLIGYHAAAYIGKGIKAVPALGIDHGIRGRQHLPALRRLTVLSQYIVMIRHDHGHPQLLGPGYLANGGNTVITGKDGVDSVLCRCFYNQFIDAVSVLNAVRNLIIHLSPNLL